MKLEELLLEGYDGNRGFWIGGNPPRIVLNEPNGAPHALSILINHKNFGLSQQDVSTLCPKLKSYEMPGEKDSLFDDKFDSLVTCAEKHDNVWSTLYKSFYAKGWIRGYVYEDFGNEAGFSGLSEHFIAMWERGLIQRILGRFRGEMHVDLMYNNEKISETFKYSHQNVNSFIQNMMGDQDVAA